MRFKLITKIVIATIVLLVALTACRSENRNELFSETSDSNLYDNIGSLEADIGLQDESVIMQNIVSAYEVFSHIPDLHVKYTLDEPASIVNISEQELSLIYEKFGDIFIYYFTIFDFTGEGEYSTVIFGSDLDFTIDPDDVTRSSAVFAIISGEPHQVRIGSGEIWPSVVVPFVFWDGEGNDSDGRPTLLFVDRNLAGNDNASLVAFDGSNLQIYRLRPKITQ